MEVLGKIIVNNDGFIVIRWEDNIGSEVTKCGLQEKASDICDKIAEIINKTIK